MPARKLFRVHAAVSVGVELRDGRAADDVKLGPVGVRARSSDAKRSLPECPRCTGKSQVAAEDCQPQARVPKLPSCTECAPTES